MSRPSHVDPREAGIASDDEEPQVEEMEECAFCGQFEEDCLCGEPPVPVPLRKRARALVFEDPQTEIDLTKSDEEETEDTEEDPAPTPKTPESTKKVSN